MKLDPDTREMFHTNPACTLPGGQFICDPERVQCGSPEHSTGRLLAGARMEKL